MRLYYAPGACSLGIHILLEEIGRPYEAEAVDIFGGAQHAPGYRAVNPKGKVPALRRDDGTVLTEYPAIAVWLARSFPETELLGRTPEGEARTLELVEHVVSTLHMRGFTFYMVARKFVSDPAAQADLRAVGRGILIDGIARLSEHLGERDWFMGRFSIADPTVFYLLNWLIREGFELPANLAGFDARMRARPAVRAALEQEGL